MPLESLLTFSYLELRQITRIENRMANDEGLLSRKGLGSLWHSRNEVGCP
jgi:hypothetical protein